MASPLSTVLVAVILFCHVGVSWCQCKKSGLHECTGGLPQPFAQRPYAEVVNVAVHAEELDHVSSRLFGMPLKQHINMTCSVFHGLRQCHTLIPRTCPNTDIRRMYKQFYESYLYLCGILGRMSYINNHQCLTNSTKLDAAIVKCLESFKTEVQDMIAVAPSNTSEVAFDTRLNNKEQLCRARQNLKVCSISAVSSACGQYAREFWFQFTFPNDGNLDPIEFCKHEKDSARSLNASVWQVCSDGSNVIPTSYLCDRDQDCYNGEDEIACGFATEDGPPVSTAIIIGIVVGVVVFIIFIVCLCKVQRELAFHNKNKKYLTDDIEIPQKEPLKGGGENGVTSDRRQFADADLEEIS